MFGREPAAYQLVTSALIERDNLVGSQHSSCMVTNLFSSINDLDEVTFIFDQAHHFFQMLAISLDREERLMKLLIGFSLRRNSEEGMNRITKSASFVATCKNLRRERTTAMSDILTLKVNIAFEDIVPDRFDLAIRNGQKNAIAKGNQLFKAFKSARVGKGSRVLC